MPTIFKSILAFCLLLVASPSAATADEAAGDKPEKWPGQWQEFRELLGKPVDSPLVQKFVSKHGLKHYTKGPSGGFSLYGKSSFGLLYRRSKIARVCVDIHHPADAENPGPTIAGKLPLGLKRDDSPDDVIRKLGKPAARPEPSYLSYDEPNMVISFDRRTLQLTEINLDWD